MCTKALTGDGNDDIKEKLGHVLEQFPRNQIKILLDFNAKIKERR
jgi:hypothetical protein